MPVRRARRGADQGHDDEYLGVAGADVASTMTARRETQGRSRSSASSEYMAVSDDRRSHRLSTASARLEANLPPQRRSTDDSAKELPSKFFGTRYDAAAESNLLLPDSFFGMRDKVVHGDVQLGPGAGSMAAFPNGSSGGGSGDSSPSMQQAQPVVVLPSAVHSDVGGQGAVFTAQRRTQPVVNVAAETDFRVSKFFPELAEEEADRVAAEVATSRTGPTVFGATLGSNRTFGVRPSGRERATRLQAMFQPQTGKNTSKLNPLNE